MVPIKRSREMVKAIETAIGYSKLTIYSITSHDSYTRASRQTRSSTGIS